jgi:hypothetical protein
MTSTVIRKPLEIDLRYLQQNARTAIRDVYDAITELVTNADDAYARAGRAGPIEIELERRRGTASLLRVRDRATGMTAAELDGKLACLGSRRHSGLASGAAVRGTNSRGAKDVIALGEVTFESIGPDGLFASCTITPDGYFARTAEPSRPSAALRRVVGIPKGTGTVVTIELDPSVKVPRHATLVKNLRRLVPLRDVLSDPDREVSLSDAAQDRREPLRYHAPEGSDRVKKQLSLPGYRDVAAKLVIRRARRKLEGQGKFREGGILIKSRRAVHEATYFAPELEHDPLAARFFGTLRCPFIDDLWNEFDERAEKGLAADPRNPTLVLDPLRQGGLRRDHPFVKALFQEALKVLRPLVDDERRLAESQQARIESDETRKRLDALERAATRFMDQFSEDAGEEADPGSGRVEGGFQRRGFALNPPFARIVVGHRQRFWLNVSLVRHPEVAEGTVAQVTCATDDITADKAYCPLEPHPARDNTLRCTWEVTARRVCPVSGVTVRVGEVTASAPIEVLAAEKDRYADLETFRFERRRYRLRPAVPKKIRVLAPAPAVVTQPVPVEFACDARGVEIKGDRTMSVRSALGIAECKVQVVVPESDTKTMLQATVPGHAAEAQLISGPPEGESVQIRIEDIDLGQRRCRWQGNVLEIAARHPSIRRYVGSPAENFKGQERPRFRVLLAEIVAYAICERILARNVRNSPEDYRDYDLDAYLHDRDELVTRFLPIAHENQVPDPG